MGKPDLFGFTRTAALELARHNITVNAISPGFIETEMVAAIPEDAKEKILEQIPLGRLGKPKDIAKAVRYIGNCFTVPGAEARLAGVYSFESRGT